MRISNVQGFVKVMGTVVLVLAGFFGLACIMAWLIQIIWNAVMPDIFGLPHITFWQAFLLQLLSNLLIKSNLTYNKKKG